MIELVTRNGREIYVQKIGEDQDPIEVDITDWSDDAKESYREEIRLLIEEDELSIKAAEEYKAFRSSPGEVIARARAIRDLKKELRDSIYRDLEDDKVWRSIQKDHGKGRVFRLDTKGGMVCARVPSGAEALANHLAVNGLSLPDRVDVVREYILGLVVHPAKEEVEKIGEQWPGLWGDLEMGVQALQSARAGEVGPFV